MILKGEEVISDGEQAQIKEKLHQLASVKKCLAKADKDDSSIEDIIQRLDQDYDIFGINCGSDEFNQQTLVLVAPRGKPEQAKLAQFDQGVDKATLTGEMVGYNASEGILLNYFLKNDLGDCGSTAEWMWTGKSFTLTNYYAMPECRGSLDFINVWKLNINKPEAE